jgi:hypothetical protein
MLSKTQIDHLGDRLKKGEISDADLRVLDEYRRSFSEGYEFVIQAVRAELGMEATGRPAKSTTSIIEKLQRESIRLTQIQDIADQEELLKLREEIQALRIKQDSFRERTLEKLRDIIVRGENDISY